MGVDFKKVVGELDNCELLREIIEASALPVGSISTRAQVASQIYVGRVLHTSLTKLSKALDRSADAANRHARKLTMATWALVLATIALVIVTVLAR